MSVLIPFVMASTLIGAVQDAQSVEEPKKKPLPQPAFTRPADLNITKPQIAIFTHCSSHFDPLEQTAPAVKLVAATMKKHGFPTLYFHDQYNSSNSPEKYHYEDRNPTAYISSDIGHYNIKSTSVRHVVALGGYYWACHKNTVRDALRLWRRDAREHDFRLTLVTDGIFDVIEGVRWGDPYRARLREYFYDQRKKHKKATISLENALKVIDDDELEIEFVRRQLPPLPSGVRVELDYFGKKSVLREIRSGSRDVPTLTIAYRRSTDFLPKPEADSEPKPPAEAPANNATGAKSRD